jgi:hypothetical protein
MNPQITMGIAHGVLFLMFFVVAPLITAGIGYAAWNGKPTSFGRTQYWVSFLTNGAVSAFLMVYAKEMRADVRTPQYLVQVGCFALGFLLFGVAGGCLVGIFAYRRR